MIKFELKVICINSDFFTILGMVPVPTELGKIASYSP